MRVERQAADVAEEVRRGRTGTLMDLDLVGWLTCTRGADGLSVSGVRGLDLRLKRGILRGRSRLVDVTVANSRNSALKARETDIAGLRFRGGRPERQPGSVARSWAIGSRSSLSATSARAACAFAFHSAPEAGSPAANDARAIAS